MKLLNIKSFFKKILFVSIFSVFLSSAFCKSLDKISSKEINSHKKSTETYIRLREEKISQNKKIQDIFNSLSPIEKICQLFLTSVQGKEKFEPSETQQDVLSRLPQLKESYPQMFTTPDKPIIPGGIILFGFNLADSKEGIRKFTDSIKSYAKENKSVCPYITVDQEGGFVNRLNGITEYLYSNKTAASKLSEQEAYDLYYRQGLEIQQCGININLAPVVEIQTEFNKDFLQLRTWGNKETVRKYGSQCINAYHRSGTQLVLKHFPGNTNTDPHSGLPVIETNQEDFEQILCYPFKYFAAYKPAGILMSHAVLDFTDRPDAPKVPSCFNRELIEYLRNDCNFDGLIFSDDIYMAALRQNGYPPDVACIKAIESGIDVLMLSARLFSDSIATVLEKYLQDQNFRQKVDQASLRVITYKVEWGI